MSGRQVENASERVAVVGGGYTGLTAALRLLDAGRSVDVFERSGHLGGLAMTLPLGGNEIEKYYHHWFTSDFEILDLIEELGLESRLRWISPVMGMFCEGAVHRFTTPVDLLRFGPLSLQAKIRLGLVTLFLQHYPHPERFESVTAAEWLTRVAGREVYECVWGPMLRSKFGRNAERISMVWIWSKMRLRGRSRKGAGVKESLGYFDGGFGKLTEGLAHAVRERGGRIHVAEPVTRIAKTEDGFAVTTAKRDEGFDRVLAAVAPPVLERIAPDLPAQYRTRLGAVEHSAVVCTLLVLRQQFSPIYWMNVSDDRLPFGGLIEHTNFVSPADYGGKHLLYISHYTYEDDPVFSMSADQIAKHYEPGLRMVQPEFSEDWVEQRMVFRDRYAQPIVPVGFHQTLLPHATPWPGLFLASMAQIYPEDRGTNYAVRTGNRVAAEMLAPTASPESR